MLHESIGSFVKNFCANTTILFYFSFCSSRGPRLRMIGKGTRPLSYPNLSLAACRGPVENPEALLVDIPPKKSSQKVKKRMVFIGGRFKSYKISTEENSHWCKHTYVRRPLGKINLLRKFCFVWITPLKYYKPKNEYVSLINTHKYHAVRWMNLI